MMRRIASDVTKRARWCADVLRRTEGERSRAHVQPVAAPRRRQAPVAWRPQGGLPGALLLQSCVRSFCARVCCCTTWLTARSAQHGRLAFRCDITENWSFHFWFSLRRCRLSLQHRHRARPCQTWARWRLDGACRAAAALAMRRSSLCLPHSIVHSAPHVCAHAIVIVSASMQEQTRSLEDLAMDVPLSPQILGHALAAVAAAGALPLAALEALLADVESCEPKRKLVGYLMPKLASELGQVRRRCVTSWPFGGFDMHLPSCELSHTGIRLTGDWRFLGQLR